MSFTKKRHIRIATEGALLGSIQEHGSINPDLVILKLGIGFWQYLEDRVSRKNSIPSLPDLMRLRVRESPG